MRRLFSFFVLLSLPICLLGFGCQPTGRSTPPGDEAEYFDANSDGGRVGNGGGGHVCRSGGQIKSAELWDFYEARQNNLDWHVDLDVQSQDKDGLKQAVALARMVVRDRWRPVDPVMAEYIDGLLNKFEGETSLTEYELQRIPDMNTRIRPAPGCSAEQIAVQQDPKYPGDKRYFIQKSIFEHKSFDATQRAGLVLHEVVYRLTILGRAEDSQSARYLTSLFFSNHQGEIFKDLETYFEIARKVKLPWAGAYGVAIRLDHEFKFSPFAPSRDHLVYGSAMPGSWAKTIVSDNMVQIACDVGFTREGLAKSFSLATREPLLVPIKDAHYWLTPRTYKGSLEWEDIMREDPCPRGVAAVYDFQDFGALKYYNELMSGIPIKHAGSFFEVDANGVYDVRVQDNGYVTAGFASGHLTFLKGETRLTSCLISAVIGGGVIVERCSAKIFNDLEFDIEGKVQEFEGNLKLQLDRQGEDQTVSHKIKAKNPTASTSISLTLKPGSEIIFDAEGQLVEATISKRTNICGQHVMSHSLVYFDEAGCVEQSWPNKN